MNNKEFIEELENARADATALARATRVLMQQHDEIWLCSAKKCAFFSENGWPVKRCEKVVNKVCLPETCPILEQ
jgi:hypothetical protein